MRLDADFLKRAMPLDGLAVADVEALRVCFRGRRYRAGETIFREGDPGGFLVLVREGELTVTMRAAGGATRVLGLITAGELCGEMALLDPAPRSATVTARTAAEGWELESDAMDVLRQNAPPAAQALLRAALRAVAARLRLLGERIDREAFS